MERKTRYYFFYYHGDFIGYTDNRKLAMKFENMRKVYYELHYLTSNEIYQLESEYSSYQIISYDFELSDGSWSRKIPITKKERLEVQHLAIQTADVDIYLYAEIPPELFTEPYRKALRLEGYEGAYREVIRDESDTDGEPVYFKPNYARTFLLLYGHTLRGGNSELWLSFASSGSEDLML